MIIEINNLEVYCNHGLMPEENKLGQKFIVSARLYPQRDEIEDDNIENTIDYSFVCHEIYNYLKSKTFKLIETAAQKLCEHLLVTVKNLKKIELEIKKPWAPIGLSLDYASVKAEKSWHTVYIGLGSNMGDKRANIETAIKNLDDTFNKVIKVSDLIITKPYGNLEQDDFLNGALKMKTLLSPFKLLSKLQELETQAKRKKTVHHGPRTLDLDILLYDDLVVSKCDLVIPHIDMQNRFFVLKPLTQICPNVMHPVLKKRIIELLEVLKEPK
ncbi:MAG: 2-amino-4-hydroxy-6-hydroxymethyldihydropteridine diphosphokinase [Firmicutes bacterium]|nr:2-amino-4-hydroxy-6-hydroxymethyldihydropteridine diphosphokinase [Bacillota bacterium]